MLLSVIVYNHKLTPGQWFGTGVVFAGISVEAWVKRKGEGNKDSRDSHRTQSRLRRRPRETRDAGEGEGEDQDALRILERVKTFTDDCTIRI